MTQKRSAAPAPPSGGKASVLIVDDHPIIRQGLAALINRQGDLAVCAEADEPRAALAAAAKERPRLAVVDISLAQADGLELIKDLKARQPKMDVLVLSMHDEIVYAERALRAGASGYVMKQERLATVIAALRQVLSGQVYLSDKMTARLMRRFAGAKVEEQGAGPADLLSDRELQILRLLGEGLGPTDIADRLHISTKTIETHRARIKEKLNLDSASALRQFAIQWTQQWAQDPGARTAD